MALIMPSPWKHPQSGTYYFRERVPADLVAKLRGAVTVVAVAGRAARVTFGDHAKVSLRTKDAAPAKLRYREIAAQFERRYEAERNAGLDLTLREVMQLAGEWYRSTTATNEAEPGDAEGWRHVADEVGEAWTRLQQARTPHELADDEKFWPERFDPKLGEQLLERLIPLDDFLHERGLKLRTGSRLRLLQEVAHAHVTAAQRLATNAEGLYGSDTHAAHYPTDTFSRPVDTAAATVDIMALFDAWKVERQPREGTVRSYRTIVQEFVAFLGHSDATRVTPENMVAWKDQLLAAHVPAKTINGYKLAAVKAVFGRAAKNRRIASNPTHGVSVSRGRKPGTRMKGYTDSEVELILRAALDAPTPGLRWVPWLCAMTGARVGEVCQLRKEDVRREDASSPWGVHFTAAAGALKNESSERDVPLHPCLIERGFLAFVEGRAAGPLFLTGRRRDGAVAKPGKGLANHVREWIKSLPGLTVGMAHGKAPAHAFRHWFTTAARRCGMDSEKREAILGHRLPGEQGTYGDMAGLAAEIAKLPDPLG